MSTEVAKRPVRIFIAMKDGPLPQSIKHVLQVLTEPTMQVFVESMSEADLIIFSNMRDIEQGYNKEKTYAYLKVDRLGELKLPENCQVITNPTKAVVSLIEIIKTTHEKLTPVIKD